MDLSIAPTEHGRISLGRWGSIVISGRETAIVKLSACEDFELPTAVAEDISAGVVLVADDAGRLLTLPYRGEEIVCLDLSDASFVYPSISLSRIDDWGLRTASVRLLEGWGAVYLTETSMCFFDETASLLWRRDENFLGWTLESIYRTEIQLGFSDWEGRELSRTYSLITGAKIEG